MRNNLPSKVGEFKVIKFKDIAKDICRDMETGNESSTGLPKSNVLYYELEDDNWCCIRPSGTEPKIKIYIGVKSDSLEDVNKIFENVKNAMMDLIKV